MNNKKFYKNSLISITGFISLALCTHSMAQDSRLALSASESSQFLTAFGLTQRSDIRLDSLESLESVLQDMESQYGPYDFRLAETLQSAGDLVGSKGDFRAAAALYERSLHITRVSNGLYGESQLALVEKLIECGASLEDWDLVDRNYKYLHFIYTRLYKDNEERLMRGLAQVSDWHLLAVNNGLAGDTLSHLRSAHRIYQQRLDLAEGQEVLNADYHTSLRDVQSAIEYQIRRLNGTDLISLVEDQSTGRRIANLDW